MTYPTQDTQKSTVIVFDLDNTLIDSGKKLERDVIDAFARLGYQVTPEEVKQYTSWYDHAAKYGLTREQFDKSFDQRKTWEQSLADGEVPIFPETHEVLQQLKERNIRLALLSKSIPKYTDPKLDFYDLRKYFEQVSTIHPREPSKDVAAIELIDRLDPRTIQRAYFIGDRAEDVTCEKAVREKFAQYNIQTQGIHVSRTGTKVEGYSSIKSLEEVLELVK